MGMAIANVLQDAYAVQSAEVPEARPARGEFGEADRVERGSDFALDLVLR